ncbi:penicillin-binding protein 2A [Bacillus mesophilus]|uniref:PBP1A family penicillin-binding protein n=1 Tax=Bacillus mesophilus TaxID=1808955 RepID=A0A6M0QDM9_9BACI|nr:PBP1A family penicillin-binding protein [Bacillus mesophilus]MBM7662710.1 penicillin-binding protein 2A [Bacillus mesophilus]NEY73228.1 PBP1A family penicillin-binding protein [Bacillus mesophilus]
MEKIKYYITVVYQSIRRFWREKRLNKILLLLFLLFILFTMAFFTFMAATANIESLKSGLNQATVIYDKDDEVASEIVTNRTKGVLYEELPEHVQHAVIAIEDQRFYEHNGFDIRGMTRAFFKNLVAGRITGGGSTITQQLTKNALLSPQKTYRRKIEELFLAVEIEKNYKKEEILEMYVNQVYFGSGAWGINQASMKYFNKPIQDVSISEAAMLAGLLQAPSARNPYKNYDQALERRNVVLKKMQEQGYISKEAYNKGIKEEITLEDGGGSAIKRQYPYYTDAVIDEAILRYGLTQEEILTRGYRIYTEMDQSIQASLENVYEQNSLFPKGKQGTLVQSGAVLIDPASGGVRGLIGGRGDYVFRGFNRATHMKAQPGSTLKPIAVYSPALEAGYGTTSMLVDEPITFGEYQPQNASREFKGEMPMYEALQISQNVPAVWLLDQIGLQKGLDSVKRFGIPIEKEDEYLGISLGGMHKGVSPLQLAEAYSVFPNKGMKQDSHLITKIVGPTGNIIAEHKPASVRVISKVVANEITSMLLYVVESGTGKGTQLEGVELAGKTGSTQLPYSDIKGTKDQWFAGYTPNLVGVVWLGYDITDREHYLPNSTGENVVPIFRAIMEQAVKHTEPQEFDVASVNDRLAGNDKIEHEKYKEAVKESVEKIKEKITEEAPGWKEKIDATLIKIVDQVVDLIQE